MVVAQLVERSPPTPKIRSSNPDIGKILSTKCEIEKTKIKKKKPGMAFKKVASSLWEGVPVTDRQSGPRYPRLVFQERVG